MFTPEQAQGIAMFLIQGLENEYLITKKVLAALPEDKKNFKLGDKGWTAQALHWHIVSVDLWFLDGIAAGEFAPEGGGTMPATLKEAVDLYEKEFGPKLAKVKALSGEKLAAAVQFYHMTMPNVVYLSFLSNHSIHHRGQLSTYIRAMNGHVPSIYGGSADEPFEMPASA